jgi:hypothetical protein
MTTSSVPIVSDSLPSTERFAWVDGGQHHTIGLTESGKVFTWGVAGTQLGTQSAIIATECNLSTIDTKVTGTSAPLPGHFQSVFAGDKFSVLVTSLVPPTVPSIPRRCGMLARLMASFSVHGMAGSGGALPLPPFPDAAWLCGPKASLYFADLPSLGVVAPPASSSFDWRYPLSTSSSSSALSPTSATGAPQFAGWTFFPNLDSDGGDVANVSNLTEEQLMVIAISNPEVVAFNTNGYMKRTLQPRSSWVSWGSAKQGMYARNDKLPDNPSTVERKLINEDLKVLWSDKSEHSSNYGMAYITQV